MKNTTESIEITKYRAPALEKGLDIIELLSRSFEPLSATEICEALQRSKAELYRMLHVLEARNYIERVDTGEHYVITRKLLTLGVERQPLKDLLEFSAPIMRKISSVAGQGVHIAVQSDDQIVVIARAEASGLIGYSVRIGYRKPMLYTASGRVLFAFQAEETQAVWLEKIRKIADKEEVDRFVRQARKIASRGYEQSRSAFVKGVADLSYPIMEKGVAIAALTVPYIDQSSPMLNQEDTLVEIRVGAELISSALDMGYVKSL